MRESGSEGVPRHQVSAARDLVLGFVGALGAARAAVRESMPSLDRLADLLVLARSGEISRRGEVGGYSYAVHGAGCRLTSPNGIDIDVDFAAGWSQSACLPADTREVFRFPFQQATSGRQTYRG